MPALVRRGCPLPTAQPSTSPCTGEEYIARVVFYNGIGLKLIRRYCPAMSTI